MNYAAKNLFGELYPAEFSTEGIKYAGSKKKLLGQILSLISKTDAKVVLDGFAGSTRVSQALAQQGYTVICNDRAVWSEVFGTCYLKARKDRKYEELIAHLNACKAVNGWFTENYGGDPHDTAAPKMPWQVQNTRKLDGIREEIDRLNLSDVDRSVALTSLILALDKVDSTIGHFSSYLRDWSPRSFNPLVLSVPKLSIHSGDHEVVRKDIFDLVEEVAPDLAYYDPPYGSNNEKMPPSRVRYAAYYHVWTTVCLNDKPKLFGKVHRREDTRDDVDPSIFEEFRKDASGRFLAVDAVHRLIRRTRARYIILSYSSGGRATAGELHEVMNSEGKLLKVLEVDYRKNVMAGMAWTNEWLRDADEPNREFLFLLEKR